MWVKKAKGKNKAVISIPMVMIILAILVVMMPMGSAESEGYFPNKCRTLGPVSFI